MDYAERGFNDKVKAREWGEVGKIASKGKIMEGWKIPKWYDAIPIVLLWIFILGWMVNMIF